MSFWTELLEKNAFIKYSKKGKCKNSCFRIGYHRAGLVPIMSLLDGGAPGDIVREYCLECGKALKQTGFIAKKQPNELSRGRE